MFLQKRPFKKLTFSICQKKDKFVSRALVSKLAKTLGNHIEVSFWLELFWAPPPLRLFTWERFLSRPEIKEGKAHSGRECQYKERLHNLIPTICAPQSAQSHPNSLRNLHSLTLGGYEQAGAEKPTEGKRGGRTEAMFAKDILSLCSA